MPATLNILLIEHSERDVQRIVRKLTRSGFDPNYKIVDNREALARALQAGPWDVVLCDYALPSLRGDEALHIVRGTLGPDVPVIFVSERIGEETAVRLMREGAQDYVRKNDLTRLPAAIRRELNAARLRLERQQADDKLDEERRLLRQLMASIPDAIYFKDRQRRYIGLNEAQCRVLRLNYEDEALGRTAEKFLPPDVARAWRDEDERVLSTGEAVADAIRRVNQTDGTVRWFSTTKVPLRDRDGNITGLVGISRDITWRKLNEQMKDEFIATVSHELRTPLTSIAGSLGLLAGGAMGPLPDSVMRLLKIAHTNCERLVRLTNEILDMKRIETGQLDLDLEPIDVRELVEEAIEANRGFASKYGVSVALEACNNSGLLLSDHDRLTQVITNLLSNAVKFSPHGGKVDVGIDGDDDALRISIRDYGPGIPEEFRGRIFEKFVQVDATDAREKGGTGLGLSIVKQIVDSFGGEVDFEPAPGGGTIFQVVLPRSRPAASADETAEGAPDLLLGLDEPDYLKKAASREIRRGEGEGRFALLRLSADQFQRITTLHGADAGHATLRALATFLKKMVRGTDGICHTGESDLLLLMPNIDLEKAQERAEYFRRNVKDVRVPVDGELLEPLSFSVGLAHFPTQTGSFESFVRSVDAALKSARAQGGDCVVLAEPAKSAIPDLQKSRRAS